MVLEEIECIRDTPFKWVKEINDYFVDHNRSKNIAIVQSSVCIDFIMVSYLFIFFFYGGTMRIATALILFYPLRNVIQTLFLMGRLPGFLWSWPNV